MSNQFKKTKMEINGISVLFCKNNEEYIKELEALRDNETIFFNVMTDFSLHHHTYFKDKKITKMKGFRKILAKIFYRFLPDVPIKRELETYSESSNKKLMCIKDILSNPTKKYVIGLAGFDYTTIQEILNYTLKEKDNYHILFIGIDYSLEKNKIYPHIETNGFDIWNIIKKPKK